MSVVRQSEVDAMLRRLGLEDAVPDKLDADRVLSWLVRATVSRMAGLNGTENSCKLFYNYGVLLNSTLANVTRREALLKVATNPSVSEETRSMIRDILGGEK
ncbi:hypothetical protein HY493_04910 [Candidatus Woesearchaeota archaeon]|nr:hypothetical protein [Candidatus Woesearchaeota archaeon]